MAHFDCNPVIFQSELEPNHYRFKEATSRECITVRQNSNADMRLKSAAQRRKFRGRKETRKDSRSEGEGASLRIKLAETAHPFSWA